MKKFLIDLLKTTIAFTIVVATFYLFDVRVNLSVERGTPTILATASHGEWKDSGSMQPARCMSEDEAKSFMRDRTWRITQINITADKQLIAEAYEIADPRFPTIGTGRIHCMEVAQETFSLPAQIRVVDGKIAGVH